MVIFEKANAKVEWLQPDRVVKVARTGFVPSDVLKEAYEAALETLERRGAARVLSDSRGLLPPSGEVLAWVELAWLPRMVRAGWQYWAALEPVTPLGAMSVRRLVSIICRRGIVFQLFRIEEEALAWLREQPERSPNRLPSVAGDGEDRGRGRR